MFANTSTDIFLTSIVPLLADPILVFFAGSYQNLLCSGGSMLIPQTRIMCWSLWASTPVGALLDLTPRAWHLLLS